MKQLIWLEKKYKLSVLSLKKRLKRERKKQGKKKTLQNYDLALLVKPLVFRWINVSHCHIYDTLNSFNPDNFSFWEAKLVKNKEHYPTFVCLQVHFFFFFFISVQSTPANTAIISQLGYLPLQMGSQGAGDLQHPQQQSGELTECNTFEF